MTRDPHDTRRCPRGHRCESCGDEHPQVTVRALDHPVGVYCLTLCPPCATSTMPLLIRADTRTRLVAMHADHVENGNGRWTT